MTSIRGTIPDELDAEFRREVARRFGMRHGALSKAMEEAIYQWLGSKSNETLSSETDTIQIR
ncbi:MAG: hypothetical protein ACFFB3_11590 [Candidatus Hodarchaeota archaeon]